jgi:hypothetical protein
LKTAIDNRLKAVPALLFLIVFAACGDGKTGPAAAATIEGNTATSLSAVAGTAVTPPPSIIVRDEKGDPFEGAQVTFTVKSGGGTVTGASVITDASGIATVGEWILGKTAGPNALDAAAGELSVTFNATGVAGPAAQLSISTGDNQSGTAGSPVTTPPAVLVRDANGNAKPGVTVTFAVGDGGGSVTGATATTSASGVAAVGSWTLGSEGANTLVASTAGVPSVTFHATAFNAKCSQLTTQPFGSTTGGTLESNDCKFPDGSLVDFYSTVVPSSGAYLFTQSAGFDTYLDLSLADGTLLAENDNAAESTGNSAIKALLPAGTYVLGASSRSPGVTGAYTVSSQTTSADNASCELVFVVKNVSTTQNIVNTDCLWNDAPTYADAFFILLRAGQSITVDMTSTTMDSYLEIVPIGGNSVAQNDNRDASTKDARLSFTAQSTNYYAIVARTATASQTGSYTLTIQ